MIINIVKIVTVIFINISKFLSEKLFFLSRRVPSLVASPSERQTRWFAPKSKLTIVDLYPDFFQACAAVSFFAGGKRSRASGS
jgi:hypothetical protein